MLLYRIASDVSFLSTTRLLQISIRRHFKQRLGLATGIIFSGGGLGVIYAAQLITFFDHR